MSRPEGCFNDNITYEIYNGILRLCLPNNVQCCFSVGCTICIGIVLAIPVSMIVMGK